MKYLLTGGAGFVGSHLADALIERGDSVLVLDDLSTGSLENVMHLLDEPGFEIVEGCATDPRLVDDCMSEVDACLHLASAVGVQLVVDNLVDSLLRNVRGIDTVLSAAVRQEKRVLFTSTSEVYGKKSGVVTEESDRLVGTPFKARWNYATSKAFGEALAHGYHRDQGADTVVVRMFNTVGPRQASQYGMVLPRFIRQALTDADLTVYGDGAQTRCFTHVYDSVRAIVALMDHPGSSGDVYNVGNPLAVPVVELARRVIDRVGSSSRVRFVPYEKVFTDGFEELGQRIPSIEKIERLTGWLPRLSLDDAIGDVLEHELSRVMADEGLRLAG
jgi:UDP-glucose 4-epimerase